MIYIYAGTLTEDENGFTFVYDAGFLRLSGWHLKNFSLYDTGMDYSLTPAYHFAVHGYCHARGYGGARRGAVAR